MGEILHKCQFGAKLSQLIHFQVIFAFYQSSTLGTLSLPGLAVESVSQCIGMEGVREKCLIPRSPPLCSLCLLPAPLAGPQMSSICTLHPLPKCLF